MIEGDLRRILDELEVQVVAKTPGGWLNCHCPMAEYRHMSGRDNSPDFFVKINPTGVSGYHCFACKSKGRISTLVRRLEFYRDATYKGLAIRADLADIANGFEEWGARADHEPEPDPLNKAAYLSMYPLAYEHTDGRTYLEKRGISHGTAELLNLQYDDEEWRILFPVFDFNSDLYGFTGRSILPPEEINAINVRRKHKNRLPYPKVRDYAGLKKERMLLGEHLMDTSKPQWLVEGLFAFAHCVEIGVRERFNVLAPLGSRVSEYQRDLLTGYNKPVWLAFDNDGAGELGIFGDPESPTTNPGAYALLKDHVPTFIPYWPEGVNDPDDLTLEDVLRMTEGETYIP